MLVGILEEVSQSSLLKSLVFFASFAICFAGKAEK